MKNFLTTLLMVTGIYATALAQTRGTTEVGVNAGYSASSVTSNFYSSSSYRSGYNVGIGGDYYFSDRWSIKARVIYDQKGWGSGSISTSNTIFQTDYQLNYLTIPVMANWHFGKTRNWYLHFGPYAGFLLNARETTLGTDVKPAFKSADVGIATGIGIKFKVGDNAKLFVELDGQDGFIDIFKQNDNPSVRSARNSINVGISIPLK